MPHAVDFSNDQISIKFGIMKQTPEKLYLDLLKKALTFTLWPEPHIPIETFNYGRTKHKKLIVSFVSWILRFRELQLVQRREITPEEREEGQFWPACADTMIGLRRLENLQFCIETVLKDRVKGDLIETGVWRGGACIFMRAVLSAYGIEDRKVYVADSFHGLPRPDPEKYPADKGDEHYKQEFLAISQSEVENNFRKYGLLDGQVIFLKGWFEDTLPNAPIEKLAILRLDGDMYGSTMDALASLYPKLSSGGFCIIDDYSVSRCKKAVDDFRAENGIDSEVKVVDWTGVYWRKI